MARNVKLPEIGHRTWSWCLHCAFTLFCCCFTRN